ncbi:hypothetical protein PSECIP111951_00695 [Pseudoalteromonas holothuriae]|uniref:Glycosyltransferase 2-like domain-containing protein n=1 Tax=Pseudoalteromonas holothuriae TaxID=2963714 RepID=A0A9W4VQ46_9GAMM|nr:MULTISPECIES: glycosyltransferase family A protein [unclassified Pseudoalteromonas]CAH9052818.1 hypothetical protein PSECIP111951_00695 [Pseudoalteromonas sp. CIP111951]CAH9056708.1 hypothetical protein PSECIP111854_01848 [Pseudoalteromonas sp. CIP111854]
MTDRQVEPLVSVLMPAYNCTKTVEVAIESIVAQTYKQVDVVIIDDGSQDDTYKVLCDLKTKHPNIRLYQNEENLGYLRTFNKLLSLAKGEFITFLDSDDWIAKDKIEKQLRFLQDNQEYGFCGTGFNRTNSKGKVYQQVTLPLEFHEIQMYLQNEVEVCFCGSSIMVRKSVVEDVGGYNEFFLGCPAEDYDWIRRMANKYKCANIPECLYYYRFSIDSLTRNVSYSIKAQSAAELALFFDQQRAKYQGKDALSDPQYQPELETFLATKQAEFDKNPEQLAQRIAINEAIHGKLKNVMLALCRLIKLSPIRGLLFSMLTLAVFIIPNDILLVLKARFKNADK